MVELRDFEPAALGRSEDLLIAVRGIVDGAPFHLAATPEPAPAAIPTV
jgi:hypothetical protein